MPLHGLAFTVAGALPGSPTECEVFGITAINSTATAATIVVREGSSSGKILAAGQVPALAGSNPGVLDVDNHPGRLSEAALYVEIDGGAATGYVWVE